MSSSKNYTTVQQFGPRKFDAVYIRSGEVVERSSYVTLSEAEHQARGLEIIGVPYRPVQPARGGFDRTATQTPDPVDVEVPLPGLLPAPEEEPQAQDDDEGRDTPLNQRRRALGLCDIEDEASQAADDSVRSGALPRWQTPAARETFWDEMSAQPDVEEPQPQADDQAEACDCFGCLFYGRCTANMVAIGSNDTFELGLSDRYSPRTVNWEVEMARRQDANEKQKASLQEGIRQQMTKALDAGHEAGRIERAADIVRDGKLDRARAKYGCSTATCDCPDSRSRGAKCKHQLAEIMAHNLAH